MSRVNLVKLTTIMVVYYKFQFIIVNIVKKLEVKSGAPNWGGGGVGMSTPLNLRR